MATHRALTYRGALTYRAALLAGPPSLPPAAVRGRSFPCCGCLPQGTVDMDAWIVMPPRPFLTAYLFGADRWASTGIAEILPGSR